MQTIQIGIFLLFLCVRNGKGWIYDTYDDLKIAFGVIRDSFKGYETLIPVPFADMTMNVTIDMSLASINDFDEIGGYLEVSGYLKIRWAIDRSTLGNESMYLYYDIPVLFKADWLWKPTLLLVNSKISSTEIGNPLSKVRCNLLSLVCEWEPWIVLRGGCTSDLRFYPFDRQSCKYKIAAWGHTASEVTLTTTNTIWDMEFFEENAEWTVESTSNGAYIKHNTSFVEFGIELKRIPTYYIINLIAPVVLLTLVNTCVFILPAESGERVSFSITCFLSFVVLLNMVMSLIPASSANLAYLCYFTFIMMIFSCGMSLATVFTLWIYFKSEDNSSDVPSGLRGLVYVLKCRCFFNITPRRKRTSNVTMIKTADSNWDDDYLAEEPGKLHKPADQDNEEFVVTWKQVASVIDVFFLLGFLGGQIFYSVGYLMPIILNK